jgi:hypothetical protein
VKAFQRAEKLAMKMAAVLVGARAVLMGGWSAV